MRRDASRRDDKGMAASMNKKMNGFTLAALGLLGATLSTAALAQSTPSLSRGNVTVDTNVLDALGPPPGATGLYAPNSSQGAPSKTKSGKPKSQFLGPSSLGASGTANAPSPSASTASATPKSSFTPPTRTASSAPTASIPAPVQSSPFFPSPAPAASPFVPAPVAPAASPFVPAAPASAPKSQTQTAALPPARTAPAVAAASTATLAFAPDSADLSDDAKQAIAGVIQKLGQAPDSRVKLSAYAAGTPETLSQTRRLSLSRALAVRSYLIDQGVKSTRIDVLALGNQVSSGSADRVDLAVVAQ
jgi:outer membrane protein OmpA-like peptidoglycan-associated protein